MHPFSAHLEPYLRLWSDFKQNQIPQIQNKNRWGQSASLLKYGGKWPKIKKFENFRKFFSRVFWKKFQKLKIFKWCQYYFWRRKNHESSIRIEKNWIAAELWAFQRKNGVISVFIRKNYGENPKNRQSGR